MIDIAIFRIFTNLWLHLSVFINCILFCVSQNIVSYSDAVKSSKGNGGNVSRWSKIINLANQNLEENLTSDSCPSSVPSPEESIDDSTEIKFDFEREEFVRISTVEFTPGFIDSHCHLDFMFERNRCNHAGNLSTYIAQLQYDELYRFPVSYEGCIAVFCKPERFAKVSFFLCHVYQAADAPLQKELGRRIGQKS